MDPTPWLAEAVGSLERSRIGEVVRITPFLYPVLESLHILEIALLVGSAVALDLRLLGIGRHALPVTVVARYLLPLSHIGFAVMAATGAAMFAGNALAVTGSPAAPWKFGLIAVTGLNILVLHTGVYRTVGGWDLHAPVPVRARAAALISAGTWAGVIVAGRLLAY